MVRYWPTWLGLGALWLLVQLPFGVQLRVGALLGDVSYLLARSRRRIARINIDLCFPEWTAEARHKLLRDHFRSLGIAILETGFAWWGRQERLAPLLRVVGLEHLQAAQQQGKGVVLLGGHMTCMEVVGRLFTMHHSPVAAIYRRHGNPVMEAVTTRFRDTYFPRTIPRENTRAILRALKDGFTVWYAPDQDFRRHHVFAPFMGVTATSLTATARIAKLSGAPVVPILLKRLPGVSGYEVTLLPPLEGFPGGDDVADATRINQVTERLVRAAPEQYLWVHRRFKTRPKGEKKFY